MSRTDPTDVGRPVVQAVHGIAQFIAVYGTLAALVLIALSLVLGAFGRGVGPGARSVAGVLLPVVVMSFLYVFRRQTLERLAGVPTAAGFILGLVLGLLTMVALEYLGRVVAAPLPELVVSSCLSVLVFSTAAGQGDRGLVWYYGVLCGLLAYVVFVGVPGAV